jgi:hypothetical protein
VTHGMLQRLTDVRKWIGNVLQTEDLPYHVERDLVEASRALLDLRESLGEHYNELR